MYLFTYYLLKMAVKHPKHRRIPKALLKSKLFAHMENKVVLGLHLLELIVILLLSAATATVAVFLHSEAPEMTEKETVIEAPVQNDVEVETKATDAATADVKKQWSANAGGMDEER